MFPRAVFPSSPFTPAIFPATRGGRGTVPAGNRPSNNALQSTVDIFHGTATQTGGGVDVLYPVNPDVTGARCSVQEKTVAQDNGEGRINLLSYWDIYFRTDNAVQIRDQIQWVDATGTTRKLFVVGYIDGIGLGRVFGVRCEEKQ